MQQHILSYWKQVEKYIRKTKKETKILFFFLFLLVVLVLRLFFLQVIQGAYRWEILLSQHYTKSDLHAERGQIYVTDKAGNSLQLTDNVDYFNLYADPKFVLDKEKVIEVITPIIYMHFCEIYGLEYPDTYTCLQNIEAFSKTSLLPKKKEVFFSSWDQQYYIDDETYDQELQTFLSWFDKNKIYDIIKKRLVTVLEWGIKYRNYLWFFDNEQLFEELDNWLYPYIEIQDNYYLYIVPENVSDISQARKKLQKLLQKYGYHFEASALEALLSPQEKRYVKLVSNMNAKVAKVFKDEKKKRYYDWADGGTGSKSYDSPLLHGFGLEQYGRRHYPYGRFMSHILWYVDKKWDAYYGVEQYFDKEMAWKDGKLIWLATPWIGQVWANSFDIKAAKDGLDVYLTIDPLIQKEVESRARYYRQALIADSIAITILDPETGKVKAMVNMPDFDPNHPEDIYTLRPLTYDERYLVEDMTYVDIPIFLSSGEELRQAYVDERLSSPAKKYIFANYLGPQTFVDKNIAYAYEPWSVFKTITLGIAIDSDTLSMYDFYNDPGRIKIWPYTIANISDECKGDHTYLHALEFSCNVGMVRIAQAMTKYIFYSYLEKLWFGKKLGIELAGEEAGTLPDFNTVSVARFFNNVFGEGILATPLQVAAAYASTVNGWYYIQPTIIEAMYDSNKEEYLDLRDKTKGKIFKSSTSYDIKDALVSVVDNGNLKKVKKEGFSLWGKTWTSEIAFKGKYQWWHGWTNGSFVGIVTAHDTKYVIAIQVRRPRSSPWWLDTAGKVFSSIADFLLAYDKIEE